MLRRLVVVAGLLIAPTALADTRTVQVCQDGGVKRCKAECTANRCSCTTEPEQLYRAAAGSKVARPMFCDNWQNPWSFNPKADLKIKK